MSTKFISALRKIAHNVEVGKNEIKASINGDVYHVVKERNKWTVYKNGSFLQQHPNLRSVLAFFRQISPIKPSTITSKSRILSVHISSNDYKLARTLVDHGIFISLAELFRSAVKDLIEKYYNFVPGIIDLKSNGKQKVHFSIILPQNIYNYLLKLKEEGKFMSVQEAIRYFLWKGIINSFHIKEKLKKLYVSQSQYHALKEEEK